MQTIQLSIDNLKLDLENPRTAPLESQRDAFIKILENQDLKLVELAESIVDQRSLNPLDRFLVMPMGDGYVVLEGNRRTAALKILVNPSVLNSIPVRPTIKKRLEAAAERFDRTWIEPIEAAVVADRADAIEWLLLRHTGPNSGRGVVEWSPSAKARFSGASPALQVLDFVRAHARLSSEENDALGGRFLTTLKRLLDAPAVRSLLGLTVEKNTLKSMHPTEVILPVLQGIVLDLAFKRVTTSDLEDVEMMTRYVSPLAKTLPEVSPSFNPIVLPANNTLNSQGDSAEPSIPRPNPQAPPRPDQPPPPPKPPQNPDQRSTLIPRETS